MTDRFAVAGGNTRPCNVTAVKYCGGNWQGIIEKLDYIQDMGFTAIWISPVCTLYRIIILTTDC
jgi:alpha-amylase